MRGRETTGQGGYHAPMSSQVPDWVLYKQQRRKLFSFPLEPHLRTLRRQPDFRLTSSTCSRGYVANWTIGPDDRLMLTHVQTRTEFDGVDPGIHTVFPGVVGPIAADWVRMRLRTPEEETLRYDPRGNGSSYRREKRLWVWDGRLVVEEEVDSRGPTRIAAEFTPQLEHFFGSEEGAFVRACVGKPDDAAPRLVYSDWLDERDDPRAGVVRLAERVRGMAHQDAVLELARERHLLVDLPKHDLWAQLLGYEEFVVAGRGIA